MIFCHKDIAEDLCHPTVNPLAMYNAFVANFDSIRHLFRGTWMEMGQLCDSTRPSGSNTFIKYFQQCHIEMT